MSSNQSDIRTKLFGQKKAEKQQSVMLKIASQMNNTLDEDSLQEAIEGFISQIDKPYKEIRKEVKSDVTSVGFMFGIVILLLLIFVIIGIIFMIWKLDLISTQSGAMWAVILIIIILIIFAIGVYCINNYAETQSEKIASKIVGETSNTVKQLPHAIHTAVDLYIAASDKKKSKTE